MAGVHLSVEQQGEQTRGKHPSGLGDAYWPEQLSGGNIALETQRAAGEGGDRSARVVRRAHLELDIMLEAKIGAAGVVGEAAANSTAAGKLNFHRVIGTCVAGFLVEREILGLHVHDVRVPGL